MNEKTMSILAAALAVLALAIFIAIGGDGNDLEQHAAWQARVSEQGAAVMW